MTKRIRIVVGIFILAVSIGLLIWAYRPMDHKTLTQPISPADMQLPTPVSFYFVDLIPVS